MCIVNIAAVFPSSLLFSLGFTVAFLCLLLLVQTVNWWMALP